MLLHRVITAAILIPLVVGGVLFLHPLEAYGLTLALVAWSSWEWTAVIQFKKGWSRWLYVVLLVLVYTMMSYAPIMIILFVSAVFWGLALVYIIAYPHYHPRWSEGRVIRYLAGIISILPCWYAVNVLRNFEQGNYLLLYLLILVWVADIAAYFAGRRFGKRKLAPEVSPNKTVEGAIGAVLACLMVALLGVWFFALPQLSALIFIAISLATALVSIVGDLLISVKKRIAGIKDTGTLLPGHGGLLDRVDSMMAATPIFTLLIILVNSLPNL